METTVKLFYDAQCPFCVWYSQLLVKYNFLNKQDRVSFQQEINTYASHVNIELATTKIACLDQGNNQVYYGIDSLLFIISKRFPRLISIARWKPFYFLLTLLYAFISYNRKIIFPVKESAISCACTPQKSWTWRIVFITASIALTSILVTHFFNTWLQPFQNAHPFPDWILLVFQLIFQGLVFALLREKNFYDYLGHVTIVSFFGAVFLSILGFCLSLVVTFFLELDGLHQFHME